MEPEVLADLDTLLEEGVQKLLMGLSKSGEAALVGQEHRRRHHHGLHRFAKPPDYLLLRRQGR